ncbi:arylesterase [Mucilaginibacter sp. Bleaf8]|uniref:arylesterase n=1 Tax=Mucilaginibacter sp. Bleaf8 TaxID=2834430 RepID=UPI001BCD559C|nr:arylesterase [Mucilaginibacter sp. Bleaf8]MBS7565753.1 arylesterase [Mucilaginibacter sp. Bleaf8]
MNNVLFLGDSLTAGYGLRNVSEESFPALIQQKINAASLPYRVINAGISGDTSAGGLTRVDYLLNQPIHIFVLELGINDILRGIPPQSTARNLQAIIDKVKARYPQAKMALMGMELPLQFGGLLGNLAQEFMRLFRTIAERNQMAFVPFFLEGVAGLAHLNLPDGVHPSAEGYRIIANRVCPVLQQLMVPPTS